MYWRRWLASDMPNFDPSAYMATGTESSAANPAAAYDRVDLCIVAALSAVCGAGISWLAFMVAVL